jgi:hypothetical protein
VPARRQLQQLHFQRRAPLEVERPPAQLTQQLFHLGSLRLRGHRGQVALRDRGRRRFVDDLKRDEHPRQTLKTGAQDFMALDDEPQSFL